ncbi:RNA polymerase sigma factor [Mangrovicoccus algicola]|uniref:Sigma-70 family RNA polymerase sigma factor n=1 Tax=Mangrovicoccus algicola TaxID=2771008 RepID=A0A8J6Z2H9_9RHOB|nr:sigma-70 family RNA polymerase sigma factor [Mangrovicoccus algicola]MBE3640461.1 sigma-70 family RNA polymerase sigma factor [Mangrovicoccus algicola]
MSARDEETGDQELLARIAAGDMTAMRALYLRHAAVVERFARSRLNDPAEAADVLHNTMLDVWRNAATFGGRSAVRSWMLSIARNKAVDLIRKRARTELAEPDDTLPDDAPDPEAALAAAQDAQRVRDCVAKLGERHRAAVQLAYFEEMSVAEIAAAEQVAEGTVKTRLFHARKLLMRCLSR